ncbi:MAG: glycosyltransferase, partial [Solirubrobacteraceae bacterium]
VSVIVPARDAAATLPSLLDCLAAQEHAPDQVVVVDDGSTDGTARLAEDHPVVERVLRTAGGEGPGAARNAGAAHALSDVLAFTDADCAPTSQWLARALEAMADADLVQGAVHAPPGVPIGPFDRTVWVTTPHGLYETANLLIRRDLFEHLGGFEPWLSPKSGKELGEDVWLGYRARRAGVRIEFCADALVHHAVEPRGPRAYIAERLRLRFFPAMARRIPELRETFLHRRLFLSERSARFDLAAVGLAAAAYTRCPIAAVAAVPYLRTVQRRGLRVGAVDVAADLVGAAALLAGSVVSRAPVL